jgi:predicted transcriptional regulator
VTLTETVDRIDGTVLAAAPEAAQRQVLGGYVGDLLSDVMANSREGDIWVTIQKHANVIAVAQLQGLAGIVLVNGRQPEPDMLKRAEGEHIPVISTPLQAFEVAGILHNLGIRGRRAT